jgi:hypothetical protein
MKISPAEEVTGLNLLFPLGVRPHNQGRRFTPFTIHKVGKYSWFLAMYSIEEPKKQKKNIVLFNVNINPIGCGLVVSYRDCQNDDLELKSSNYALHVKLVD